MLVSYGIPQPYTGLSWYRAEDRYYANVDEFGDYCGTSGPFIEIRLCRVLRFTPKGAWVWSFGGGTVFVRRDAKKRYACPTIREAMESLARRREVQASFLGNKMHRAQSAADLANRWLADDPFYSWQIRKNF